MNLKKRFCERKIICFIEKNYYLERINNTDIMWRKWTCQCTGKNAFLWSKKTTGNVPFFGGGGKRYVWDFLSNRVLLLFFKNLFVSVFHPVKVSDEYDGRRSQWQQGKKEKAIICYINEVRSIEKGLATFGKDGRFQSWCCSACKYVLDHEYIFLFRLHLLSDWFQLLSECSDACLTQFYDPVKRNLIILLSIS
jgi:hypothetical protein